MKKISVLISGRGSNLAAIIQAIKEKKIDGKILSVVADRDCEGKQYAFFEDIPFFMIDRKLNPDIFVAQLIKAVEGAELIVCAGFLSVVPDELIDKYQNKIINLHPSLLPEFGGKGMYGLKVHKAVIDSGKKETGCTVHFVNSQIDGGKIIAQEKLSVLPGETAEQLQKRLAAVEHALLIRVLVRMCSS